VNLVKKILKWMLYGVVIFVISSVLLVVIYKFVPAPITLTMINRVFEGAFEGRSVGINKDWVSYEDISPNFFKAVISGEDGRFFSHDGFDWKAIDRARKFNERQKGGKLKGASTISMQTSKNAFLWQGRNYVRKAFEAYFTFLIEKIWGKKRILEMYVNIIEMGDGIYGIEAASQSYFKKSAKDLSKKEAALIAAVLPNPRRWSPAQPSHYIESRANFIMGRMGGISLGKAK
jgi:monofunctional biosynthetic peptidoglycan transglycosylase